MKSKLIKNIPIEIPLTPNFIKVRETYYPIQDFTEDELEDVGELWTKELIKKAKTLKVK